MSKYRLLVALFFTFPLAGVAQTACPIGVPVGSAQCGPSAGPIVKGAPSIRPVPTGRWQKTWGAIAMDEVAGNVGTSVDMDSRRDAEQEAMRRCQKPNSVGCKVRITYRNQCVALAWSDQPGHPGGLVSGPGLYSVREEAVRECRKNGGGTCAIVHSECSDPKFIPY